MKMRYTQDLSLIKKIMTDDDIWLKINDIGINKDEFNPVLKPENVSFVFEVNEPIGLAIFTKRMDGVYYHPMILKPYRAYAREAIKKSFDWYFKNVGGILLFEIPEGHKSTINLAKKFGAVFEKVNNGKVKLRLSV